MKKVQSFIMVYVLGMVILIASITILLVGALLRNQKNINDIAINHALEDITEWVQECVLFNALKGNVFLPSFIPSNANTFFRCHPSINASNPNSNPIGNIDEAWVVQERDIGNTIISPGSNGKKRFSVEINRIDFGRSFGYYFNGEGQRENPANPMCRFPTPGVRTVAQDNTIAQDDLHCRISEWRFVVDPKNIDSCAYIDIWRECHQFENNFSNVCAGNIVNETTIQTFHSCTDNIPDSNTSSKIRVITFPN